MRVLLIVLEDRFQQTASEVVQAEYPECELVTFTKQELAAKSAAGLIKLFRGEEYLCALIFSQNLEHQTKLIFLKAILLLIKAKNRKIVDARAQEEAVNLGGFIAAMPLLALEVVLTIAGLIALFLILHILRLYLKLTRQGKRRHAKNNSRQVVFLRTEYAFGSRTGGMARYYQGFGGGIKAWGYNALFLSNDDLDVSSAPVHVIKFWKIFNSFPDTPQLMYNFKYFWQAYKILKKSPPALLFQISEPYNFCGALLATLFKVPFFLNVHDADLFTAYLQEKIYLSYYGRLIERVSLLAADAFFPVSSVLKESLLAKDPSRKVIIKHMGVDPDQFKPQVSGSQEIRRRYPLGDKIVVGYAGSFFTNHGLEVLAAAVKLVLEKNSGIHFLLLGDGRCYPIIKQFFEREGLEGNVSLPGAVPLKQVPAHLAVCDICVAPYTQEYYGTPSKAFEYMAMQKGVVASDLKSIREVINDGETGLLVAPGNAAELAAAILRLAEDQKLRLRLGKQAREEVIKKYTWKATEGEIIKAYEDLRIP